MHWNILKSLVMLRQMHVWSLLIPAGEQKDPRSRSLKRVLENSECLLVLYLCFEGCPPPFLFIIHTTYCMEVSYFSRFYYFHAHQIQPIKYFNWDRQKVHQSQKMPRYHTIGNSKKYTTSNLLVYLNFLNHIFLVENCVSWRIGAMDQMDHITWSSFEGAAQNYHFYGGLIWIFCHKSFLKDLAIETG